MSLTDLLEEIEAAKDPKKAGPMEAYMRHQFSFLGVAAPERNKLYKKYFPEAKKTKIIDWDFVDTCWEKESREYQYVATKSWWDTVDILDRIVGSLVYDKPEMEKLILQWSLSDNIWLRRVAIDHQLLRKAKTNVQLMEKILQNNLNQTEFFINKSIGWALRDYSKTNPAWVETFIEKNKERMADLSIKEASKYLSHR